MKLKTIRATVIVRITQQWDITIPEGEIEAFTSPLVSDEDVEGQLPIMDAAIDAIEHSVGALIPADGNNTKFINQRFEDIFCDLNLETKK